MSTSMALGTTPPRWAFALQAGHLGASRLDYAFGHEAVHEDYLGVIRQVCDDPVAAVRGYVLRDVLNLALENPDNHGRNTALQNGADGTIRLAPLYDFCPMRLDPRSASY